MFGSYTLWRYAQANDLKPGVFKIRPFVHETSWHPFPVNGADALFLKLRDVPEQLPDDGKGWFLRPVEDSKKEPGNVKPSGEIIELATPRKSGTDVSCDLLCVDLQHDGDRRCRNGSNIIQNSKLRWRWKR